MLRRGLPGWTGQSLKQGGRVVGHHTEAFVGIDTSEIALALLNGEYIANRLDDAPSGKPNQRRLHAAMSDFQSKYFWTSASPMNITTACPITLAKMARSTESRVSG